MAAVTSVQSYDDVDAHTKEMLRIALTILKPTATWSFCHTIIARNSTLYFFRETESNSGVVLKWHKYSKRIEHEMEILSYLKTQKGMHIVQYLFGRIMNKNNPRQKIPVIGFSDAGPNLATWKAAHLTQENKLPVIKSFLIQAIKGISFLHEHEYVHNLIEPSTICIKGNAESFHLTITSFGAAKDKTALDIEECHPGYTSPEAHLIGYRNDATDVFSVGVIAAELIIDGSFLYTAKNHKHTADNSFLVLASLEARGHPIPSHMVVQAELLNNCPTLLPLLKKEYTARKTKGILPHTYFTPLSKHLIKFMHSTPEIDRHQARLLSLLLPGMIEVDPEERIGDKEILTMLQPPDEAKE